MPVSPEVVKSISRSPGGSLLGKPSYEASPTGVRCRKPMVIAEGLTADSPME